MKKFLKFKSILLLTVFTAVLVSCSDDDEDPQPMAQPDIVDLAIATSDLTNLVAALTRAGLVDDLQADGNFTVLAPTNAAFEAFLTANNFASLDEVPVDLLTQVLLNHVIAGDAPLTSGDLTTLGSGYTNTLAAGPVDGTNLSIYFDASSGVEFNGVASVTGADNSATNGVVHIIDAVIGLPTIATFATTNPALSSLVAALQLADTGTPTVPYITTVSDPEAGPFTVFAPTNDAFADLLLELDPSGDTELSDLDPATVDGVLTFHIVNANVQSSGLPNGAVATLGGEITADNTAFTLTDPNGRVSNIITTLVDIQSTNGVVHVIDKVILPLQE